MSHNSSRFGRQRPRLWILAALLAALLPAVLPPAHMLVLYHFWRDFGRRVHRKYCSCSCWDTVFKGPYEQGVASYKHVYFNATSNTFNMWALTVVCVISLYECSKRVLGLIVAGSARWSFCLLFALSLPSHYYTWWVFLNYWNDDFYEQWYHQLFFTVTELISTVVVLHLADKRSVISPGKVAVIVGIAGVHTIAASMDQFVGNVLLGEGASHQVVRDLMFMVPDVLHIALPLLHLYIAQRNEKLLLRQTCNE